METEDIATGPGAEETGNKADEGKAEQPTAPERGTTKVDNYFGTVFQSVPGSQSINKGGNESHGAPSALP